MNRFNEDSRVKIPTILHLTKIGYKYLSLKSAKWDTSTNIFTDIFGIRGKYKYGPSGDYPFYFYCIFHLKKCFSVKL